MKKVTQRSNNIRSKPLIAALKAEKLVDEQD